MSFVLCLSNPPTLPCPDEQLSPCDVATSFRAQTSWRPHVWSLLVVTYSGCSWKLASPASGLSTSPWTLVPSSYGSLDDVMTDGVIQSPPPRSARSKLLPHTITRVELLIYIIAVTFASAYWYVSAIKCSICAPSLDDWCLEIRTDTSEMIICNTVDMNINRFSLHYQAGARLNHVIFHFHIFLAATGYILAVLTLGFGCRRTFFTFLAHYARLGLDEAKSTCFNCCVL